MSLAGRPKEGGGHKGVRFSIDEESRELLGKLRRRGRNVSDMIDDFLHIMARQIDPGPSSKTIIKIHNELSSESGKAAKAGDYERAAALSYVAVRLQPFVDLSTDGTVNIVQDTGQGKLTVKDFTRLREVDILDLVKTTKWVVAFGLVISETVGKIDLPPRLEKDSTYM